MWKFDIIDTARKNLNNSLFSAEIPCQSISLVSFKFFESKNKVSSPKNIWSKCIPNSWIASAPILCATSWLTITPGQNPIKTPEYEKISFPQPHKDPWIRENEFPATAKWPPILLAPFLGPPYSYDARHYLCLQNWFWKWSKGAFSRTLFVFFLFFFRVFFRFGYFSSCAFKTDLANYQKALFLEPFSVFFRVFFRFSVSFFKFIFSVSFLFNFTLSFFACVFSCSFFVWVKVYVAYPFLHFI